MPKREKGHCVQVTVPAHMLRDIKEFIQGAPPGYDELSISAASRHFLAVGIAHERRHNPESFVDLNAKSDDRQVDLEEAIANEA